MTITDPPKNCFLEAVERHERQLRQEHAQRQIEHARVRAATAEYDRLIAAMDDEAIIYPHTEGGFPVCAWCFQCTPDLSMCADQRDGELRLQCFGCYCAVVNDRPLSLPTGERLIETWLRIARLHQNKEIDDDVAALALATLAPHLAREDGWAALALLQGELLELQAEDPDAVLNIAANGLDHDDEAYASVDGAVHELIGGAR